MGNTASKREDSSRGEVGPHHMLLIGETGSGKTSFLNLVCNFQLVHRLGFDTDVTQFRKYNHIHLENQVARTMESKTTGSALYEVQFDDVRIGIVDTPGFGDTRGLDLDKKNVKNIVDKVKDSSYMHCICFVINGRNARATPQFNYVVSEVSAVLPKMSVQNMIVVVTNTKDEFESNVDLSELTRFLGLEIPRDHIFYLENPYCKLEKLKLKGQIASDVVAQDLKRAFTDASITLEAILKTMMRFNSMNTCDFMTLFLMKEAVERTTLELMVACQNQTALSNVIRQKKQEIDEAVKLKQLNQSFVKLTSYQKWSLFIQKIAIRCVVQKDVFLTAISPACSPSKATIRSQCVIKILSNCVTAWTRTLVCVQNVAIHTSSTTTLNKCLKRKKKLLNTLMNQ